MKLDDRQLHKFLGWNTQGDLGPYTFYTDKRRNLVFFLKAPPEKPASYFQTIIRQKLSDAAHIWNHFPAATKANWEAATKRLSLKLTGYNLYTFYHMTGERHVIRTIERQSALQLLPPE